MGVSKRRRGGLRSKRRTRKGSGNTKYRCGGSNNNNNNRNNGIRCMYKGKTYDEGEITSFSANADKVKLYALRKCMAYKKKKLKTLKKAKNERMKKVTRREPRHRAAKELKKLVYKNNSSSNEEKLESYVPGMQRRKKLWKTKRKYKKRF